MKIDYIHYTDLDIYEYHVIVGSRVTRYYSECKMIDSLEDVWTKDGEPFKSLMDYLRHRLNILLSDIDVSIRIHHDKKTAIHEYEACLNVMDQINKVVNQDANLKFDKGTIEI